MTCRDDNVGASDDSESDLKSLFFVCFFTANAFACCVSSWCPLLGIGAEPRTGLSVGSPPVHASLREHHWHPPIACTMETARW